ncbi:ABC transporter ATP-binding protein [Serpentinicella alkaliphila]|uniref:ABC-2 type transport system ATP-binding protein n=1 Tax=Serpentinicella alkaliphila TaxID=1734049 RepID=A0A4R2SWI9_9FIRM|nr:ABC transporter ATP-binding protein [Serpentinicella alkaliphila]QUH26523.1 ABC transporter ATP-binding protein [Serpentinicella alkaliphila]TCP94849.1 ABC-2 type transport system ATP-binding protein [Serpentinicella alkaliphila]
MIEFKGVTKKFGNVKALDNITVTYPEGKIIGLLGPNGSGKSTTLKMIASLNKPDTGEVLINGKNPSIETRKQIAYLPEIDYLYSWMTVRDANNFMKGFYDDWNEDKNLKLMKFLQLEPNMIIKKISKGMRAKVKLLLAFSRDAKIVLLDEPLSGIDILTREQIIETIISDYSAGEQTIIISTHEIQEIEGLVDDVVFLKNGNVILQGDAESLRNERTMSLVELMKGVYQHGDF